MSSPSWPFSDPENVAVFTVAEIASGRAPILRVCHDEEDGAWQFLTGGSLPDAADGKLVSLKNIVMLDPTIRELSQLPLGWEATRASANAKWTTQRQSS
jgi:hypothetical protein